MRFHSTWGLVPLLLWGLSCEGPATRLARAEETRAPQYGDLFKKHWQDGKAELASYELTYPRYGELRKGSAVTVFVTEPHAERTRVKPENPAKGDFSVIKLNLVQDFQTGIYDYNLMTSVFAATEAHSDRPAGTVSKVSFSAQEWCGHAYMQALFRADEVQLDSHSYFEGEADRSGRLEHPAQGLSEDALWLWARGLAGPVLNPGQRVERPMLRSLERVRLDHVPWKWDRVALERQTASTRITVPAGSFEVDVLSAEMTRDTKKPKRWTFEVEKAPPHRLVRVRRDDGYEATLVKSTRLPYWQLHDNAHVSKLAELGLSPRPQHTP